MSQDNRVELIGNIYDELAKLRDRIIKLEASPKRSVPHKCPVCNGQRTVSVPPHVAGDIGVWVTNGTGTLYPCPACQGSGILWEERR